MTTQVEYVVTLINQLTPRERLDIVQRILPDVARMLPETTNQVPIQSLYGICAGMAEVSHDDITEMRHEAWENVGDDY